MAKMLRESPETVSTLAEFTEPYGTIQAVKGIAENPTDPMNYLYAVPLLGDVAKAGKVGKVVKDTTREDFKAFLLKMKELPPWEQMEHMRTLKEKNPALHRAASKYFELESRKK
jgi:hypothetical protein